MESSRVDPGPAEQADARRKRRTATIVIVVVLGLVFAGVWLSLLRDEAPIEAAESPTPPAPETTPGPTPEPTEEPGSEEPPLVALTVAGDLVLLDPETGEVLEGIASDGALRGPISLAPDRSHAYLTRDRSPGREVVRVALADGTTTVIADGYSPSLSPDGQTLAFIAPYNINHPGESEWRSLALLGVSTGELQYLPDNSCGGCARRIDQPAWAPDGSQLYLAVGFEDSAVPSLDLVVVAPGTTTDLDTAAVFQPNDTYIHGEPGFPAFLADGTLAVVSVINYGTGDASDGLDAHYGTIETFNAGTATLIGSEQFAELHSVADDDLMTHAAGVAASTTSNTLAIVAQDWSAAAPLHLLYRWDGGTELRLIAQDIVAVAW